MHFSTRSKSATLKVSRIDTTLSKFVMIAAVVAMLGVQPAEAKLKEGQDFPALKVAAFPGKAKVDAAKYKGKVVIVDFWASWCEPCKIELPALNKLHKKYKGKLVVIGVNVDEKINDAKAFLKDHPVDFDLVHDAGQKNASELGIEKMPTSFILSNGKIVKIHEAFRQGDDKKIDEEVKKLLSGK